MRYQVKMSLTPTGRVWYILDTDTFDIIGHYGVKGQANRIAAQLND